MSPLRPRTALALLLAACTSHNPGGPPPMRDVAIVHEPCDLMPLAAPVDPAVFRVEIPACTAMDLNGDGKPEVYNYSDAEGRTRRSESDFDADGGIDEISHYEAGTLVRRDRDLDFDQRLDSWEFHEHDNVVRREDDSDGDGRPDRWWTFTGYACPHVEADNDGDGRPDPGSRVEVCP